MFIKHKSFDVSSKRKSPRQGGETLYAPRHCPFLKYLIIPSLIGFMLLCILINVDFENDTRVMSSHVEKETKSAAEKVKDRLLKNNFANRLSPAATCSEDVPNCALTCSDGSVGHLDQDLEYLQSIGSCSNRGLSLTLGNCQFVDGIMKSSFFVGDYRLRSLTILKSNLKSIQSGAFKMITVQNIKSLAIIGNAITSLEPETFEGLKVLAVFRFLQEPLTVGSNSFKGNQFLKPMAATLENATIRQSTTGDVPVNPKEWLRGTDLKTLYTLDLSNNNLQGVLDGETFRFLVAVRLLYLQNCFLDFIDMTFFMVMEHLSFLDLGNNRLRTVDAKFLEEIHGKVISLNMGGNEWSCDCENKEMIEYLQGKEPPPNLNLEEFICFEPIECKEMPMLDVRLDCEATRTTEDVRITTSEDDKTTSQDDKTTSEDDKATTEDDHTSSKEDEATTEDDHPTSEEDELTSTVSKIPTTLPPGLLDIQCFTSNSSELTSISLKPNLMSFSIHTISDTSVVITSSRSSKELLVIYFNDKSQYQNSGQSMPLEWQINHLEAGEVYLFCVALNDSDTITVSPFDCRGHAMPKSSEDTWLFIDDIPWSVIIVVLCALVCCLLGMLGVYSLLHKRPSWLFASTPSILRKLKNAHKIVLLPKKSQTARNPLETRSPEYKVTYLEPRRWATDVGPQQSHSLYNSLYMPPTDMAPTIPNANRELPSTPSSPINDNDDYINPIEWRRNSTRPQISDLGHASNIYHDICPDYLATSKEDVPFSGKSVNGIEDDYQVIDHYEEVTF